MKILATTYYIYNILYQILRYAAIIFSSKSKKNLLKNNVEIANAVLLNMYIKHKLFVLIEDRFLFNETIISIHSKLHTTVDSTIRMIVQPYL